MTEGNAWKHLARGGRSVTVSPLCCDGEDCKFKRLGQGHHAGGPGLMFVSDHIPSSFMLMMLNQWETSLENKLTPHLQDCKCPTMTLCSRKTDTQMK